jgi:hypothetical protein
MKRSRLRRGGLQIMQTKYFLTALFQTKYGTSPKYYDDTGWHWLLPGDKPILFGTIDEAKPKANELEVDVLSRVNINEIQVHDQLFETRYPLEDAIQYTSNIEKNNIAYTKVEGKFGFIITFAATPFETNKKIEGLYPIDKREDHWIYVMPQKATTVVSDFDPNVMANHAYHKLEEAKAKMNLNGFPASDIQKLEGVMTFVSKIIKEQIAIDEDFDIEKTPEKLVQEALSLLQDAKTKMAALQFEKTEIAKFESISLLVSKIVKV